MSLNKVLLVFGLVALCCCALPTWAQDEGAEGAPAPEGDGDGNMDSVEDDGGRAAAENDGNDGDDTSVGANPPGSLIGCQSPYSYVASQNGLALLQTLVDVSGLNEGLKYRNFSGTFLAPSNNAIRNLAAQYQLDPLRPTDWPRAFVRSVVQYHVLFDPIDPTTLAAVAAPTPYDTALSLTASGENAGLEDPVYSIFTRNDGLEYQNVTLVVTPLGPGVEASAAPNGTYRVEGGSTSANIIWDATNEPTRTCVGFVYKVDGVLLPAETAATLSAGAVAPTGEETGDGNDENAPPGEGDGEDPDSDGSEAAAPAEGDGDAAAGDGNDESSAEGTR